MFYVPGSGFSLAQAKADGADVRVVYSISDALEFAREEKSRDFVFISIGFETTTPAAAAAIITAKKEGLANFSVLSLNKTMPEALRTVLGGKDSRIEALICPGHVSTVTGTAMYAPIVNVLGISCCIAGFEPADILRAVYMLTELHEKDEKGLINAYERAVRTDGNPKARYIMDEVFEPADSSWRGFGVIPGSGLKLRDKFRDFDVMKRFDIKVPESKEAAGCICGDILRGTKRPADCKLFQNACTPSSPKGACMVSSEGACAAWHKYKD